MKADIRIFKDSVTLSKTATDIFIQTAKRAIEIRERFLVALSGGSTPSGLYRLLANEPYRSEVNWKKTFVFWGDERCVPPDNAGSNYHQANETLLRHVPLPKENILRVKGELQPEQASDAYAQTLKDFADLDLDWPRFDLALLGMGDDGHTASLFPGSPVEATSPTQAVTGHYQGRPAKRVTLTPLVFNSTRKVLFLVTGESKAVTLSRVLSDGLNQEQYPAQRIHPTDGQVIWLIDKTAATNFNEKSYP